MDYIEEHCKKSAKYHTERNHIERPNTDSSVDYAERNNSPIQANRSSR